MTTDKNKNTTLKVIGVILGILGGLIAVGFMPKISDIATIQDVKAVDDRVRVLETGQAEMVGELRAIRILLEHQNKDTKK